MEGEVMVYRNLRKQCFSVMDRKTRRVVRHVDAITLRDVRFMVSQAGRRRAVREKQRNVHAFVCGVPYEDGVDCNVKLWYNPFVVQGFVDPDGNVVERADFVSLRDGAAWTR